MAETPRNPFGEISLAIRARIPAERTGPVSSGDRGERFPRTRTASPGYTSSEVADRAGLTVDDMGRLWRALGFAELPDGTPGFTDEDVEAVREVAGLAGAGIVDIDQVIRVVRPMGYLVSRLGAAQVSALDGLRSSPGTAVAGRDGAQYLVPLLERLVVHAWRRHLVVAASAAVSARGLDDVSHPQAVGFIDIANYTTLSRRIAWPELAALLDRFEACVFDRVATAGGRVVKTLGDEALFVVGSAVAAAEIALDVLDAVRDDPDLPAVHGGLAYGPLLERAGDVFGPTVNIASRVTDLAGAGAVLVDPAFRHELGDDPRFRFRRRPPKKVPGYVSLGTFRLRRAHREVSSRTCSPSLGRKPTRVR
ncbi:MAG: adenylate cyclase [Actinomycetota bacterium]|nr:adenylate cyclase [Actinomycetota bacterium]